MNKPSPKTLGKATCGKKHRPRKNDGLGSRKEWKEAGKRMGRQYK